MITDPRSSLKVDFQCRVNFTCVLAQNLHVFANKMEAVHERSLVSVKVDPRSTSRLSSAHLMLPLFYFVIKIYVR